MLLLDAEGEVPDEVGDGANTEVRKCASPHIGHAGHGVDRLREDVFRLFDHP
ncbi:MAG: hypothetical protein ACKO3W_14745 [bacterium]